MTATTTSVSTLAAASLLGTLTRATVVGADKKGRTLVEMTGVATEAEAEWGTMCATLKFVRFLRVSGITEVF